MTGIMYLIGGGEIRNGETKPIDDQIISLKPKGSNFVFFGYASQDNKKYADTINLIFGRKYKVIVPTIKKGKDFAIEAIKNADLIYLGGGDTEKLLQAFQEWGLIDHIRNALRKGAHVVGMSAGALALSSWYIHDEGDKFEIRKGWGLTPLTIMVHANQKTFNNAKILLSNQNIDFPFIAIGEGAAWRIDQQESIQVGQGTIWLPTSN